MNEPPEPRSLLPSGMSPRAADNPRWREVAGALAAFFAGGAGPTHSALGRAFDLAGYDEPPQRGSKEDRVRQAVRTSDDHTAMRVVEEVLGLLRDGGSFASASPDAVRLGASLSRIGASLSAEGFVDWPTSLSSDPTRTGEMRTAAEPDELGQAAMLLLERDAAAAAVLLLDVQELEWEPKPADYAPDWADAIAVLVVPPHAVDRFTDARLDEITEALREVVEGPGRRVAWTRVKRAKPDAGPDWRDQVANVMSTLSDVEIADGRRDGVGGRDRHSHLNSTVSAGGTVTEVTPDARPARDDEDRRRRVFLVQGRNRAAADAVTALLEAADLRVLEWEQAVQHAISVTESGSPYIGDIVREGIARCYATIVLFTGDDLGCLHPLHWSADNPEPDEQQLLARARQNVVFEAGLALGHPESRVVFVELGRVAGFSDIAGRHAVRLDDSPETRKALLDRLANLGCRVDLTGTRWMKAGDLAAGTPTSVHEYRLVRKDDQTPPQEGRASASLIHLSTIGQWRPAGEMGSHATDLVLACAVQVPAGAALSHDPDGHFATRLRGEPREARLAELLARSPITGWFARTAPSFHISSVPVWTPTGYNTGEWSELALQPPGPSAMWPALVSVSCKLNTGWMMTDDTRQPGLAMFTELRFRLLELDSDRKPAEVRHETTPAPAPGALRLGEAVDALAALFHSVNTAVAACEALTGSTPVTGQAVLWLYAFGGSADRVVDLSEFRVIPGSPTIGEQPLTVALPVAEAKVGLVDEGSARRVAAQLLRDLLERCGRRGTAQRLAMLEQSR